MSKNGLEGIEGIEGVKGRMERWNENVREVSKVNRFFS